MRVVQEPFPEGIAGVHDHLIDEGSLSFREVPFGMTVKIDALSDSSGPHVDVPVGTGAGDNTVVVIRVSLCFHQGLAAARGAPFEIGIIRIPVIEGADDLFGFDGHFMG